MIKQTFLEARQLGSKTSQSSTNGDYTTMLNEPVIIKEGDELMLQSSYIDTIDITDNHVVIEEDTELTISYYMYADMGGYGINDFFIVNQESRRLLVETPITRYYNNDPYDSPILHGQAKGVLSSWTLGTEISGVLQIANAISLAPVDKSQPLYGGGTITLSFIGLNDITYTITQEIPQLNPIKNPFYILDMKTMIEQGETGIHRFLYRITDPQIKLLSNNLNIKFIEVTDFENLTNNILIPVLRKKKVTITKGRYSPENIVEILNDNLGAIHELRGGTERSGSGAITRPLPDQPNLFNLDASDTNDELGNHFLTTALYLPLGEVEINPPAVPPISNELKFKDRMFFTYATNESYQVFSKGKTSPISEAEFNAGDRAPPETNYMIGSNQGIQFEYDDSTSKISIVAMHSPFVVNANPLPDSVSDPIENIPTTLGFSYQITSTPKWNPATPNHGEWQLEPFEQNKQNGPDYEPYKKTMDNRYQTDLGGVLIQNLEPASFWEEKLGFNLSSLVSNPNYNIDNPINLTGFNLSGDDPPVALPTPNDIITPTPPPGVILPEFNLTIGKNYTGNYADMSSFRNVASLQRYIEAPFDFNTEESIHTNDATPPILGYGVNPYQNSTSDTFKIEAKNRVLGGDLDSAYYFVEVDLHQNKMLNSNGGEKRTIAGIINRYYSVSSYTSTEGGFSYIHRGEPMVINSLHVRILMPDGSMVKRLGEDNAIFLKLISKEALPTPDITEKQTKK